MSANGAGVGTDAVGAHGGHGGLGGQGGQGEGVGPALSSKLRIVPPKLTSAVLVSAATFPTLEFGVNCPNTVTVGARTCVSFDVEVPPPLFRMGTAPCF